MNSEDARSRPCSDALKVESHPKDRHRPPISVVTGVNDKLVVGRQRHPRQGLHQVVQLDDGLGSVAQATVPKLEPEAATAEVVLVRVAQAVRAGRNPDLIERTPPRLAVDLRS